MEVEMWEWMGGIAAAVIIAVLLGLPQRFKNWRDGEFVYKWMLANSGNPYGFRSTRAIASGVNMTEDRVRILCSEHKKIKLSTGNKPDMWTLGNPEPRGMFDLDDD